MLGEAVQRARRKAHGAGRRTSTPTGALEAVKASALSKMRVAHHLGRAPHLEVATLLRRYGTHQSGSAQGEAGSTQLTCPGGVLSDRIHAKRAGAGLNGTWYPKCAGTALSHVYVADARIPLLCAGEVDVRREVVGKQARTLHSAGLYE